MGISTAISIIISTRDCPLKAIFDTMTSRIESAMRQNIGSSTISANCRMKDRPNPLIRARKARTRTRTHINTLNSPTRNLTPTAITTINNTSPTPTVPTTTPTKSPTATRTTTTHSTTTTNTPNPTVSSAPSAKGGDPDPVLELHSSLVS